MRGIIAASGFASYRSLGVSPAPASGFDCTIAGREVSDSGAGPYATRSRNRRIPAKCRDLATTCCRCTGDSKKPSGQRNPAFPDRGWSVLADSEAVLAFPVHSRLWHYTARSGLTAPFGDGFWNKVFGIISTTSGSNRRVPPCLPAIPGLEEPMPNPISSLILSPIGASFATSLHWLTTTAVSALSSNLPIHGRSQPLARRSELKTQALTRRRDPGGASYGKIPPDAPPDFGP
jgi:hypothetical protein